MDLSPSLALPMAFCLTALWAAIMRRHRAPWKSGVFLLLNCALITFAHHMRATSPGPAARLFWFEMLQAGWAVGPASFLWLAFHYSGSSRWLTNRTMLLLSVVPVLRIALTVTNDRHGLVWDVARTEAIVASMRSLPVDAAGPLYWPIILYAYALMAIGSFLLVRLLVHTRGVYRRQSIAMLFAALLASTGVGLDVFGFSPAGPFVASQLGLGSGIITVAFALRFLRRSDLLRATRENILNNINDAILIVDPEGRLAEVNTTAARLIDLPKSRILGRPLTELLPELPEFHLLAVSRANEIHLTRNSHEHVLELRLSTMTDMRGMVLGRVITIRDITERKRAEERIQSLNAELERRVRERTENLEMANKELETFAYSVSHDLRAPLRLIGGYARILEEDYMSTLDDGAGEMLRIMQYQTRWMGNMIDSLLAFSRTSRATLTRTPIDMQAMVVEVLEMATTAEQRERIVFSTGALPPTYGDPVLIRQVWTNLISNAVKFSAASQPPSIRVTADVSDSMTTYAVSDNGTGFDMQYAGKLFGVFQRLHNDPGFPGTGVGLAIVHRIVQRHGGTVWAEAEVGKGATFRFTLPRADASSSLPGGVGDQGPA